LLHGIPQLAKIEGDVTFGSPEIFSLSPMTIYKKAAYFAQDITGKSLDTTERLARIMPTQLSKLMRLYQIKIQKRMPTDRYGRPKLTEQDIKVMPAKLKPYATKIWKELPTDIGTLESIMLGLGFPTKEYGRYQTDIYELKGMAAREKAGVADIHRTIAQVFADNLPDTLIKRLKQARFSDFGEYFTSYKNKLPKDKIKEINDLIAEAKKNGDKVSIRSFWTQLEEYLQNK
jgi:hypothetical protein